MKWTSCEVSVSLNVEHINEYLNGKPKAVTASNNPYRPTYFNVHNIYRKIFHT